MGKRIKESDVIEKQTLVRKQIVEQYIEQRKNRQLTQTELASAMGVTRPNISRFETGEYNPSLDLLVKMAECMELEIEIKLTDKRSGRNGGKE